MTTEYINSEKTYVFDNEDAKGIVKIVPSDFGVSVFVDGKEIVYVDLFYKAQPELVERTFFPDLDEKKRGYIVQERFSGEAFETELGQRMCRVIPIDVRFDGGDYE